MGKRAALTVDELVSTLRRSNIPTVVVEGENDLIALSKLEERLSHLSVSLLPAGGRNNVLEVFKRRHEIGRDGEIVFVVDKDCWVLTGVPEHFINDILVMTEGYSIENDAMIDGRIEDMLSGSEIESFRRDLALFTRWMALELSRFLAGSPGSRISAHPNEILDSANSLRLPVLKENETYPEHLRERVWADYQNLLRGKSLLALYLRQLSYPGRAARHNGQALIDVFTKSPGTRIGRIFSEVEEAMRPHIPE